MVIITETIRIIIIQNYERKILLVQTCVFRLTELCFKA